MTTPPERNGDESRCGEQAGAASVPTEPPIDDRHHGNASRTPSAADPRRLRVDSGWPAGTLRSFRSTSWPMGCPMRLVLGVSREKPDWRRPGAVRRLRDLGARLARVRALRVDPKAALASSSNPAIAFFGRDLLGEQPGSVSDLWELREPVRIVRRQASDGSRSCPGKSSLRSPTGPAFVSARGICPLTSELQGGCSEVTRASAPMLLAQSGRHGHLRLATSASLAIGPERRPATRKRDGGIGPAATGLRMHAVEEKQVFRRDARAVRRGGFLLAA